MQGTRVMSLLIEVVSLDDLRVKLQVMSRNDVDVGSVGHGADSRD